ncbi:MAG: oligosaccharide repeat unit polymerase [Firmicutes bacterium]|nr:oligosaccharide repeat unit polymerase [Bacillota bacterium]
MNLGGMSATYFLQNALYNLGQTIVSLLYIIWAGISLIVDLLEDLFNMIAGIDTIYSVPGVQQPDGSYSDSSNLTGDGVVTNLISSSIVQNIFFSLMAVAVVLLLFFTIIQLVRNQYKEKDGGNPFQVVFKTIKGLVMFMFITAAVLVGLQLSGIVFTALRNATSGGHHATLSGMIFEGMAGQASRINQQPLDTTGFEDVQQERFDRIWHNDRGGGGGVVGPNRRLGYFVNNTRQRTPGMPRLSGTYFPSFATGTADATNSFSHINMYRVEATYRYGRTNVVESYVRTSPPGVLPTWNLLAPAQNVHMTGSPNLFITSHMNIADMLTVNRSAANNFNGYFFITQPNVYFGPDARSPVANHWLRNRVASSWHNVTPGFETQEDALRAYNQAIVQMGAVTQRLFAIPPGTSITAGGIDERLELVQGITSSQIIHEPVMWNGPFVVGDINTGWTVTFNRLRPHGGFERMNNFYIPTVSSEIANAAQFYMLNTCEGVADGGAQHWCTHMTSIGPRFSTNDPGSNFSWLEGPRRVQRDDYIFMNMEHNQNAFPLFTVGQSTHTAGEDPTLENMDRVHGWVMEQITSPHNEYNLYLHDHRHTGENTTSMRRIGHIGYRNVRVVYNLFYLGDIYYVFGFLGILVVVGVLINFMFAALQRIIDLVVLYMMSPITVAFFPFDEGNSFKSLFVNPFYKKTISIYAVVLSLNIFFLLLPVIRGIRWYNEDGGWWRNTSNHHRNNLTAVIVTIAFMSMLPSIRTQIQGMLGADSVSEKKTGQILKDSVGATFGQTGATSAMGNKLSKAGDFELNAKQIASGRDLMSRTVMQKARDKARARQDLHGGSGGFIDFRGRANKAVHDAKVLGKGIKKGTIKLHNFTNDIAGPDEEKRKAAWQAVKGDGKRWSNFKEQAKNAGQKLQDRSLIGQAFIEPIRRGFDESVGPTAQLRATAERRGVLEKYHKDRKEFAEEPEKYFNMVEQLSGRISGIGDEHIKNQLEDKFGKGTVNKDELRAQIEGELRGNFTSTKIVNGKEETTVDKTGLDKAVDAELNARIAKIEGENVAKVWADLQANPNHKVEIGGKERNLAELREWAMGNDGLNQYSEERVAKFNRELLQDMGGDPRILASVDPSDLQNLVTALQSGNDGKIKEALDEMAKKSGQPADSSPEAIEAMKKAFTVATPEGSENSKTLRDIGTKKKLDGVEGSSDEFIGDLGINRDQWDELMRRLDDMRGGGKMDQEIKTMKMRSDLSEGAKKQEAEKIKRKYQMHLDNYKGKVFKPSHLVSQDQVERFNENIYGQYAAGLAKEYIKNAGFLISNMNDKMLTAITSEESFLGSIENGKFSEFGTKLKELIASKGANTGDFNANGKLANMVKSGQFIDDAYGFADFFENRVGDVDGAMRGAGVDGVKNLAAQMLRLSLKDTLTEKVKAAQGEFSSGQRKYWQNMEGVLQDTTANIGKIFAEMSDGASEMALDLVKHAEKLTGKVYDMSQGLRDASGNLTTGAESAMNDLKEKLADRKEHLDAGETSDLLKGIGDTMQSYFNRDASRLSKRELAHLKGYYDKAHSYLGQQALFNENDRQEQETIELMKRLDNIDMLKWWKLMRQA